MSIKKKKRPYKRPTVKTEKVYERRSLACGKTSPMSQVCIFNNRNS